MHPVVVDAHAERALRLRPRAPGRQREAVGRALHQSEPVSLEKREHPVVRLPSRAKAPRQLVLAREAPEIRGARILHLADEAPEALRIVPVEHDRQGERRFPRQGRRVRRHRGVLGGRQLDGPVEGGQDVTGEARPLAGLSSLERREGVAPFRRSRTQQKRDREQADPKSHERSLCHGIRDPVRPRGDARAPVEPSTRAIAFSGLDTG